MKFTVKVHEDRFGDDIKLVAQCQEFDICVQGKTIQQLKERFVKTLRGHELIAKKHGLEPYECLLKPDHSVFKDVTKTKKEDSRFTDKVEYELV